MPALIPLTKVAKGHVERLGRDQYLAVIKDNKRGYYELIELDPHSAQQAAMEFCARNGIALQIFTVPEEVQRAHLNDIQDFLTEHEGQKVKAEWNSMRRAV